MREMVTEDEISEWRTSIRGSVSCPVVRPAEPGCLSEQSSSASRCSVQGAAPLAMLRIYPCTTMKGSRLLASRLPLMVFYYPFTFYPQMGSHALQEGAVRFDGKVS